MLIGSLNVRAYGVEQTRQRVVPEAHDCRRRDEIRVVDVGDAAGAVDDHQTAIDGVEPIDAVTTNERLLVFGRDAETNVFDVKNGYHSAGRRIVVSRLVRVVLLVATARLLFGPARRRIFQSRVALV